ncbi:hypothetical protein MNBD_NITROSPIRAE02-929, partial [hydrothermal vent metagenome]
HEVSAFRDEVDPVPDALDVARWFYVQDKVFSG